jgi:hypothetical protein
MYTTDEILEVLGEEEVAMISHDFWLKYHNRIVPGKTPPTASYAQLLAFQNGWLACKNFYKIND